MTIRKPLTNPGNDYPSIKKLGIEKLMYVNTWVVGTSNEILGVFNSLQEAEQAIAKATGGK